MQLFALQPVWNRHPWLWGRAKDFWRMGRPSTFICKIGTGQRSEAEGKDQVRWRLETRGKLASRTLADPSRRHPGNPWALDEGELSPIGVRPGDCLAIPEAVNSQVLSKGRSSRRTRNKITRIMRAQEQGQNIMAVGKVTSSFQSHTLQSPINLAKGARAWIVGFSCLRGKSREEISSLRWWPTHPWNTRIDHAMSGDHTRDWGRGSPVEEVAEGKWEAEGKLERGEE